MLAPFRGTCILEIIMHLEEMIVFNPIFVLLSNDAGE